MKALLLAFLLAMTRAHGETPDEHRARMDTAASAMVSAALEATCTGPWKRSDWCRPVWPARRFRELVALQATIAIHESGLMRRIALGDCRRWECDAGLARGYFQAHRHWYTPEEWDEIRGAEYEPVATAALGASRALGVGLRRCGTVEGATAHYACNRCSWSGTPARLATYRRLLAKL